MKKTRAAIQLFAALSALLAGGIAMADESGPAQPEGFDKLWYILASSSFAAGIIFLFLAAIVTAYIAKIIRDRCLRAFRGFPATVELKDDTRRFGRLDVERTGLEFVYMPDIRQEIPPGVNEASYLLFSSEYQRIYLLLRFLDQLSPKEQTARTSYRLRIFNRKLFWRARRKIRNVFAALKDAFLEAMNMVIGRMKGGAGAGSQVLGAQQRYVSQIGGTAIGYLGENSFDPLLEKQIGRRMIVEVFKTPVDLRRFEGTFTEYSGEFLLFTESSYATSWSVECPADGAELRSRGIVIGRAGSTFNIANSNPYEITVSLMPTPSAAPAPAGAPPVPAAAPVPHPGAPPAPAAAPVRPPVPELKPLAEVKIAPQETGELALKPANVRLVLRISSVRRADVIIPRAIGWVRSKAETQQA